MNGIPNLNSSNCIVRVSAISAAVSIPVWKTLNAAKDLQKEAYVSFKTDQMSDALWPIAMLRQQEDFTGPIIGTSSHLEEVKRLIIAGFGFGPLPVHVVEEDVRRGLLWRLPPYENPPEINVYLAFNPVARRTRAEALLLDRLVTAISQTPLEEQNLPKRGLRRAPKFTERKVSWKFPGYQSAKKCGTSGSISTGI